MHWSLLFTAIETAVYTVYPRHGTQTISYKQVSNKSLFCQFYVSIMSSTLSSWYIIYLPVINASMEESTNVIERNDALIIKLITCHRWAAFSCVLRHACLINSKSCTYVNTSPPRCREHVHKTFISRDVIYNNIPNCMDHSSIIIVHLLINASDIY